MTCRHIWPSRSWNQHWVILRNMHLIYTILYHLLCIENLKLTFFFVSYRSQDVEKSTLSIGHNWILCAICKPGDLDLHLPQESGLSCSRMLLFVPCACAWDARRGLKIPNPPVMQQQQQQQQQQRGSRNCGEVYGIVGNKLDGVSVDIQGSV